MPFSLFRDRNYSLMLVRRRGLPLGHPRLVPAVHDLPAVRAGLLALQAGLVLRPELDHLDGHGADPGRLTDRIGGKYILMSGLALFGLGTAMQAIVAQVDSSRWVFLPGVIIVRLRPGRDLRADDHRGDGGGAADAGRRGRPA